MKKRSATAMMEQEAPPSAAVPSSVTSASGVEDSVGRRMRVAEVKGARSPCPKCNGTAIETPSSKMKSGSGSTGKRKIKFSASAYHKDLPCSCKARKIHVQEKNAKSRLVHPVN